MDLDKSAILSGVRKTPAIKLLSGRMRAGATPVFPLLNGGIEVALFSGRATNLLQQFRQIAPVKRLFNRRFAQAFQRRAK
jgi:hypothetical protein